MNIKETDHQGKIFFFLENNFNLGFLLEPAIGIDLQSQTEQNLRKKKRENGQPLWKKNISFPIVFCLMFLFV